MERLQEATTPVSASHDARGGAPGTLSDMTHMDQPKTTAECLVLLTAVLSCLDAIVSEADEPTSRSLSFAAIRVQEAIDLIRPLSRLDS